MTDGSVLPVSQFRMVAGLTPSCLAASRCGRRCTRRQRLTCSPKVLRSKFISFGFTDLSRRTPSTRWSRRAMWTQWLLHRRRTRTASWRYGSPRQVSSCIARNQANVNSFDSKRKTPSEWAGQHCRQRAPKKGVADRCPMGPATSRCSAARPFISTKSSKTPSQAICR